MTLDIKALLKNLLKKQMSIQHFTAKTEVFSTAAIPSRIKSKIKDEFGEQYLEDANYIVFFRGEVDKDGMKKLFNLTNKAFGEDANRMTEGDFKKISFVSSDSSDDEVPDEPEEDADEQPEELEEPPSDASDAADDSQDEKKSSSGDDKPEDDDGDDDQSIDDEVDEIVNEDQVKLDEDVNIDSTVDAYVFLKITTK